MQRKKLAIAAAVLFLLLVGADPPLRITIARGLSLLSTGQFAQFKQYLQALGTWAPIASIGLMVLEALAIPLPVTLIMLANGLVFGVWYGALVSVAGALAGAVAAYAIGRWIGRALLDRTVPASSLRWADALMAKYGRWAIVLERWIPGVPGDPISYAAGLTRVPLPAFLGLTAIGVAPAALVTALTGSQVAGDVPFTFWLSGVLLAVIAWLAWRRVRRWRARRPRNTDGTVTGDPAF
jgi:uncharacterized membrane protein YdjX (TVP38/TMEM64 family)